MKSILLPLAAICTLLGLSQNIPAQTRWQWLRPSPQGNGLSAVAALDDSTAVAVGANGTVIKTANGGVTWVVNYAVGGATNALSGLSFVDANTGTAVGWSSSPLAGTILRTSDGGQTWTSQTSGTTSWLDAVSFSDANHGTAVGQGSTIIHTTNGGATWTNQTNGASDNLHGVSFFDINRGIAVGGTSAGVILRTTNGGAAWTVQLNDAHGALRSVSFADSSTIVAVGDNGRVVRSTDAGVTWNPVPGAPVIDGTSVTFVSGGVGAMAGSTAIYRTTDKGATWTAQLTPPPFYLFNCISLANANTGIAVGSSGVIFHTSDGGAHWIHQSEGEDVDLHGIAFADSLTGLAVGGGFGGAIIKTTDGGTSWQRLGGYSGFAVIDISFPTKDTAIGVGPESGIVHTTNGGATWTTVTTGVTFDPYRCAFSSGLTGTVVGSDGTIIRTTDGGGSWATQPSGTAFGLSDVFFTDQNTGTAVGDAGTILRTTNGGSSWSPQASGTTDDLIGVCFTDANTGTAVGNQVAGIGRILRTTDGGATWHTQLSGIEFLYGVSFLDGNTGIAVGQVGAAYFTHDGGATWHKQAISTSNYLFAAQFVRNGGGAVAYIAGEHGTIICSAISPLNPKTWTGTISASWNGPGNWSPPGVPAPADSVIIPAVSTNPEISEVQQQVAVAGLNILSGAKLTVTESLPRFVIEGDVNIGGVFEVRPPAATSIVVGGDWRVTPGPISSPAARGAAGGGFSPSKSTVYLTGSGTFTDNFFNLVLDTASSMTSAGNVTIGHQLSVLHDANLRVGDTLTVESTEPNAISGAGQIARGSIRRAIQPHATDPYRFESDKSFIRFDGAGTNPSTITITSFPDSSVVDTSIRWSVVPSVVDTITHSLRADSVIEFSKWAFGIPRPRSSDLGDVGVNHIYTIDADAVDRFNAQLSLHYQLGELKGGVVEGSLVLLREEWQAYRPQLSKGWNLLSVPVNSHLSLKAALFPHASSPAFAYNSSSGYQLRDSLLPGVGFWLNFSSAQSALVSGPPLRLDTLNVVAGWNLIGSLGYPVAVSGITSSPGGIVTSRFFEYDGSYRTEDTIRPARGYWVKVNQDGKLILSSSAPALPQNKIRIVEGPERPPDPPDSSNTKPPDRLPAVFALEQNYPNPFNPQTVIRFQLPVDSRVTLQIYDLLGQEVATLVNGVQVAGYRSAVWNAGGVATGLYFYRLQAAGVADPTKAFREIKKMLLIR